jgi:hypothetical protein
MTTPFKKVVKAKLKSKRELNEKERTREEIKYEIAGELGLTDKVKALGWSGLTAVETGKIGGIMTRRNKLSGRVWNDKDTNSWKNEE